MHKKEKLKEARKGSIHAFNDLFALHEKSLKSYLYRLLTNRQDVEDFYHNTFVKAFDKLESFNGTVSQLKSWIFTIATRLAYNYLNTRKRWDLNAQDVCRDSLVNNPENQKIFMGNVIQSRFNSYEIREHIDFCFTCISKTVSLEQQIALLLREVYQFKVKEIAQIMGRSEGKVKHYLLNGKEVMTDVFENRCALINKKGTCHQCSELQGIFNPKTEPQRELIKIQMVKDAEKLTKKELFLLRQKLIAKVNPMESAGMDLHDHLMQHMKKVSDLD